MRHNEKVYCCESCGFLFQRTGSVTECPSCEEKQIRFATPEEHEQLSQLLKEILGMETIKSTTKANEDN